MKMTGSAYFLLFLLLLAIVLLYVSFQLTGLTPLQTFQGRLLPVVMSISLAVLTAFGLFVELRKKAPKESPAGEEETTARRAEARREVDTIVWIIGYLVVIFLIGFDLANFLLVGAYLKAYNHGWVMSIACGLVWAMLIYVLLDFLLGVDLYEGIIYIPLYDFLP